MLWSLVGRRVLWGCVTLLAVSLLIFLGTEILPGDVAESILGQEATPEAVAALRRDLGLDVPPVERYLAWVGGLLRGDLGLSLASGKPVAELVGARLGNTFFLAGSAALVAIPLSLALGLVAALHQDRPLDRGLSMGSLVTISAPEFLIGYILIYLLSVNGQLFPALSRLTSRMDFWQQLHTIALPCLTLTAVVAAHTLRMTRASIIPVLSQPYIETAVLKGVTQARVVVVHALPNALAPIISVVMLTLAYLVVGVVVVEVVFSFPGMGKLMVDGVAKRDIPLVQACGLLFASVYILLNLLADVLAVVANPRLRHPK